MRVCGIGQRSTIEVGGDGCGGGRFLCRAIPCSVLLHVHFLHGISLVLSTEAKQKRSAAAAVLRIGFVAAEGLTHANHTHYQDLCKSRVYPVPVRRTLSRFTGLV